MSTYKWSIIDNSYSTSGTGSSLSPYNWSQFLANISLTATDERTYYLSGTRISDVDVSITLNGDYTTTIDPSSSATPYKIICSGTNNFTINDNVTSTTNKLYIHSGFIEANQFSVIRSSSSSYQIIFGNMWIKANGYLLFENEPYYSFVNSTVRTPFWNIWTYYRSEISAVNSIFDVDYITGGIGSPYQISYLTTNNSVYTKETSAYSLVNAGGLIITKTNCHESWVAPNVLSASVQTISAADISYLTSGFNVISASTASGNKTTTIDGGIGGATRTWYGGTRDGVGALYFPTISVSLSANNSLYPLSAYSNTPVIFTINDVFTTYNATSAEYRFTDGSSPFVTTTETSASHTYLKLGKMYPWVNIYSKNNWYISQSQFFGYGDSDCLTILASSASSATFIILDSTTSASITSAYIGVPVLFSASSNGSIFSYIYNFGDNLAVVSASSSEPITMPIVTKQYICSGTYFPAITVNKILTTNEVYTNASADNTYYQEFSAVYNQRELYVDINSVYDTNTGNVGTSADPFNYNEFSACVVTSGLGYRYDIYKLKGNRDITSTLSADCSKNYTIDAWNQTVYGPWVFSIQHSIITKPTLSFEGCILKNGIIYNQPYSTTGGRLIITNIYDTYIVNQGTNAQIMFSPYNTIECSAYHFCGTFNVVSSTPYVNIIGSTLYTDWEFSFCGNINFCGQTTYSANMVDSVITGFKKLTNPSHTTSANLYIYNCTFDRAFSAISADFTVSANVDSQYSWIPPVTASYPFLYGNQCYKQNIDWLLLNKSLLKPFSGISAVPNPGKGYDTYEGYTVGLYGNSRKDYVRG